MHDTINHSLDVDQSINLEEKTCPNREQRAGFAIKAYYGNASQLVKDAKEGHLEHKDRAFEQSGGCILNFFTTVRISTIQDGVMIVHAPVGCSALATGYRETFRAVPVELGRPQNVDFHWLTTNLSQKDVIFGGKDKLRKAILEAEKRHSPKSIFILTSCVSGIIGDDIEGVVSSVQPEVKAKIVPIHCEGHRSRVIQTAYDAMWHGILKYLVKKPEKKQEDLVNLPSMLSYTWADRNYMIKLLGKMGLRANFIPEFSTTEQLETMSEAAVTAPLCPTFSDYLARGLEQDYGVPYFTYPSPMGFAHTDEWLRKIAGYTGKEEIVEKVISEERKLWEPEINILKEKFIKLKPDGSKPTVLGAIGQGRLLTQNPFFHEMGLALPATFCLDFDGLAIKDFEKMIEEVGDFKVLVNTFQGAEQAHIGRNVNPDFYLTCPMKGGSYKRNKSITRIHALRGDPTQWSAQIGYAGSVAFANFMLQSINNKAFPKTLHDKTADIYKDWWYKQPNPLHYLEEAQ